jgi:hypothetical protein
MPALTRLIIETELFDRTGGLLALVGKPTTPATDPGNPTYTGPIGFSCARLLGVYPATPGSFLDGDLSGIDPGQFYSLCDVAEYRIINTCLNNFTDPDQAVSQGSQNWNGMMLRFQARMLALEVQYAAILNIRRMPVRIGPMKSHYPTPAHPRHWGIGRGRTDH